MEWTPRERCSSRRDSIEIDEKRRSSNEIHSQVKTAIEWFWKCLLVLRENDDQDWDDYNKHWRPGKRESRQEENEYTSFFLMVDGSILILNTHAHKQTNTREKPIKTEEHPLNSRIYYFCLLCFALFHFALWFMFRLLALFSLLAFFSPPSSILIDNEPIWFYRSKCNNIEKY